MRRYILLSLLFCMIASPAFAALTDADLDKIRLIVKEEVKKEIESSETRMKTYIDTKIGAVNTRIDALDTKIDAVEKRLEDKIGGVKAELNIRSDGIEKQVSFLLYLVYALIALIVLAVGIPQLIRTWRSRRDSSLENRVEILTQEIEALKRQHIVKP